MDTLGFTHRVPTVRDGYREVCNLVRDHGDSDLAPRGQEIREMRGFTLVVDYPTVDAMPHSMGRGINPAIGAAEAAQLIGGVSDPALMARISPVFKRFMDGGAFAGAYGPRARWQWGQVLRRLQSDEDSRQAVVTIFDPAHDLFGEARDVPCTLTLQFFLRDDELELHTSMRSNDVWWGLAYDAFQFTQAQVALAAALGCGVGRYVHRAGSMHLYLRDLDAVEALEEPKSVEPLTPALVSRSGDLDDTMTLARALLGDVDRLVPVPSRAGWYRTVLDPHLEQVL